jgi:hypothetical protein
VRSGIALSVCSQACKPAVPLRRPRCCGKYPSEFSCRRPTQDKPRHGIFHHLSFLKNKKPGREKVQGFVLMCHADNYGAIRSVMVSLW